MHFYNLPRNFGAGLLARGCTYQKKIAYTRLSLSPPLEERARGEVGGVGPWLGPTTQLPSIDTTPSHWTWCVPCSGYNLTYIH